MILRAAAAVDPNKIQQFHDFYSKNVINEPIHFKKHKHFALFLLLQLPFSNKNKHLLVDSIKKTTIFIKLPPFSLILLQKRCRSMHALRVGCGLGITATATSSSVTTVDCSTSR